MSTIDELNEKIAELEKQRDALAEKTGGFKVGDKVLIEGVVSGIEDSYSHPLKVKMKGGQYDFFRPYQLRHATPNALPVCWANFYRDDTTAYTHDSKDAAERHATSDDVEEIAVPLYQTPPDASKRIAELENQCEKIKAEAKRWKEAYEDSAGIANSANMATIEVVCDLAEARKEIEDLRDILCGKNVHIDLLQDWLAKASAFKSKPTCDTTCDSPDQCCNTKPAKPATTVDGDCDKVDWADDAENWGWALNDACFAFMEAVPDPAEQSMYRSGKTALRAAILKYAALVQAAKGGGGCDIAVAPKGVKEDIKKANRECEHTRAEAALIAHNYKSTTQEQVKAQELWVNASRKLDAAIDQIIELPEPSDWAVSITRLGVPPIEGCGLEFRGHELDIAAALIKAVQEVDND